MVPALLSSETVIFFSLTTMSPLQCLFTGFLKINNYYYYCSPFHRAQKTVTPKKYHCKTELKGELLLIITGIPHLSLCI